MNSMHYLKGRERICIAQLQLLLNIYDIWFICFINVHSIFMFS
jgi:hypothetical protein